MRITDLPQSSSFSNSDVLAIEVNGVTYKLTGATLATALKSIGSYVTGVKGNSETDYRTGNVNITPANIGLGNVDNTSDANKPVSTATQTALDALQAAILANFAGAFVQATAYPAGTYVTYTDGNLYILPNGHEANATWANTTKTQVSVGGELSDLKSAISDVNERFTNELVPYNAVDALTVSGTPQNGTVNGVTYTFSGNKCTAVGTNTNSTPSYRNIFASNNSLPYGIKAGEKIYVKANSTDSNLSFNIFFYKPNASLYPGMYFYSDTVVVDVPSDAVGMIARINVPGNKTVNGSVEYAILTTLTNAELEAKVSSLLCAKDATPYVSNNTVTLSDITEDGFYVISSSYTVTDAPTGQRVTGLTVEQFSTANASGFVKQIVEDIISPSTSKRYYRFSNNTGALWSEWVELTGASYTNEYTFNEYSQTVNLTANPQITSDTNNYLAPSGDTTDRTADILAMLTSNKICRLGTGDYYVSDLQMPNNSALIGSGSSTVIHLIGSSDGYAIKPGNYCTISDLTIDGGTPGTFGETIGNRHGILWQGNYTESQTAPMMCRMNNLLIRNFSGGGITCYDTGYGTFNGIEATNIVVLNCWAGINISYWSEFHKFTNVRCYSCRVGCVNNGGNNIFVNCDFSKSKEICMLMDNSQSQSPNNSHGSCIGCVFNHADSGGVANSGIGIKMLNCDNGFIFSGCQIFYAKVELDDSDGVCFTNCNFGYANCNISVSGGKAILFSGNIHQDTPTITISNNADVHFVNCYNRTTGAVVEPS